MPGTIRNGLAKATSLIEQADDSTPAKAKRLLKRARSTLRLVRKAARNATRGKHPKLSTGCASAIQATAEQLEKVITP